MVVHERTIPDSGDAVQRHFDHHPAVGFASEAEGFCIGVAEFDEQTMSEDAVLHAAFATAGGHAA